MKWFSFVVSLCVFAVLVCGAAGVVSGGLNALAGFVRGGELTFWGGLYIIGLLGVVGVYVVVLARAVHRAGGSGKVSDFTRGGALWWGGAHGKRGV